MILLNALLFLFFASIQALAGVDSWHFVWPDGAKQCDTVPVVFTGGVPPWQVQVVPIGAQPIVWETQVPPNPVNSSYPFTATLSLQLAAGTPYVVIVSDAEGFNEALNNPTAIQIVQPSSDQTCFAAASPVKKDFDFQVYGSVTQCDRSFGVTWTTSVGKAPYSCTIVPLDSSYNPWNVQLAEEGSIDTSAVWRVNMTAGTRFTVIMHDGYGEGRGGVGQIYEVQSSSNSTCVTQQYNGRADWPAGLQVNSVPTATTAWGAVPSQTDSGSVSIQVASSSASASASPSPAAKGSSIGTGAIAGIAVGGAAVALGIVAFLFWFFRRKRRNTKAHVSHNTDLLGGGGAGGIEPKVEPYRPVGDPAAVPFMGYGAQRTDSGYGSNQMVQLDDTYGQPVDTPGTFASTAPILGAVGQDRPQSGYSSGKTGMLSPTTARHTSPGSPSSSQGYFGAPASVSHSSDTKVSYASRMASNATSPTAAHPLPPLPLGAAAAPEFRRHVDAGEVEPRAEREVVDLPPLYGDVPQRGPK